MHFSVLKWGLLAAALYIVFAYGRDQGIPAERRLDALERRMAVMEIQLKAQHLTRTAPAPKAETPIE